MKDIAQREKMQEQLKMFHVELTTQQLDDFDKYYELLVEWNSFMNLTGITEYSEVLQKHFIDSLAINRVINLADGEARTIIDVGTGAGFPGVPIKLAFPQHKVTLLDSLNKRIKFLNEVLSNTNSDNVETIHGRAEEYAVKEGYRQSYDIAVSRAVANLATLAEYCLPYVKVGGYFVAYKSGDYKEELRGAANALKILGAKVVKEDVFTLPDSDIERSLIVIQKVKDTPKKFPRKAGLPSKEPLK